MSRNHKEVCRALNYLKHFLVLVSAGGGCVSISAFVSLLGVPVGIANYALGLKFFAVNEELETISQSSQKGKKHENIKLLAKAKLNAIKVLICKA